MLKWICLIFFGIACSTPDTVQDVYTQESNYFDYEYYGEDLSDMDTFSNPYDYYYYSEPAPPVLIEEMEEEDADDWFFEDY
ncbi:MAG: hypothetical protein KC478_03270 [Bacteriovoracaceae bacterium]|nr:hypothetical protein [Bacteriovoracaceae bacterium]